MAVFLWWLATSALGVAALPLAFWLLGRLPGRGLLFARPLGLLIASYILWIGAWSGIFRNDSGGAYISLLLLIMAAVVLMWKDKGLRGGLLQTLRAEKTSLIVSELLFGLGLVAWAGLRAFTVEKIMPTGGEKFMEMAFLNGVLNSPGFPPLDPWLSGFPISYYYFGYVQMGFLTRLSGLQAGVAFELHDALLFAFALQLPFALVNQMTRLSGAKKVASLLAGLSAALFTSVMGNLEGLFEALYSRGWLPTSFTAWLALPGFPPEIPPNGCFYPGHAEWWWWRASRVLNDLDFSGKAIPANPITEFPFFSFLLGDNHPHVLALPFVFLAAALALDWCARGTLRGVTLRQKIPRLALSALLIGSLVFLNTWDFPIYFALALLGFLGGEYARASKLSRAAWLEGLERGVWLAAGAAIFYLPFLLDFTSQASGILPYVFPPTRLVQYFIMFGPFLWILAFFLPSAVRRSSIGSLQPFHIRRLGLWWLRVIAGLVMLFLAAITLAVLVLILDQLRGGYVAQTVQSWLGGGGIGTGVLRILVARWSYPWLFILLSLLLTLTASVIFSLPRQNQARIFPPVSLPNQNNTDEKSLANGTREPDLPDPNPSRPDFGLLFASLLILTGLALTFSVEFFYLRDSFSVRMNTVFKFYFQGWVLFASACGYALWWIAHNTKTFLRFAFLFGTGLLIVGGLVYPLMALLTRTQEFSVQPVLDGTSNLRNENPDDWAAIDWLRAQYLAGNIAQPGGQPPEILEAPCRSYCYEGRISAFTGFPTVLGWSYHEAQWRGSYTEQARREADIKSIYTEANREATLNLLAKWHIRYVILGRPEMDYIKSLCSQATPACDPVDAAGRLERYLNPVFRQGGTSIYAVPSP